MTAVEKSPTGQDDDQPYLSPVAELELAAYVGDLRRKPYRPIPDRGWGSATWPRRDWPAWLPRQIAANNIDREHLARVRADDEARSCLVLQWDGREDFRRGDRVDGLYPSRGGLRDNDGVTLNAAVVVTPAPPRPWRALKRPLANKFMKEVDGEERRIRRSGGDSPHISRGKDLHALLYHGVGAPDGRCVCHWAAGFDKQREHGLLCHGCDKWLDRHKGKTREDRVDELVRARRQYDLHYREREEHGYGGHEVLVDPNQGRGGFEPPDTPYGESLRHATSIPYRANSGGEDDDNEDDREADFYEAGLLVREQHQSDSANRAPRPNPVGTPQYRQTQKSENAWINRWFGLRVPCTPSGDPKRMAVRMRDRSVDHPLVTWTHEEAVYPPPGPLPSEYGQRQKREMLALLRGEDRVLDLALEAAVYEDELKRIRHIIEALPTEISPGSRATRESDYFRLSVGAIRTSQGGRMAMRVTTVSLDGPGSYTIGQASEVLNLPLEAVREFITEGLLSTFKVGGDTMVPADGLVELISKLGKGT
jgi:hypothetical protein